MSGKKFSSSQAQAELGAGISLEGAQQGSQLPGQGAQKAQGSPHMPVGQNSPGLHLLGLRFLHFFRRYHVQHPQSTWFTPKSKNIFSFQI